MLRPFVTDPAAGIVGRFLFALFPPARRLVNARPATCEAYQTALNHWWAFAGETPLEAINSPLIDRFLAFCLDRHGPATCNKTRSHLTAIFRQAVREGRMPRLPEWRKLREPRRAPLAFTIEGVRAILSVAATCAAGTGVFSATWWRALLLAIWYTGARISALLAVETADFDEAAGGLYVRSAGSRRTTRISSSTSAKMRSRPSRPSGRGTAGSSPGVLPPTSRRRVLPPHLRDGRAGHRQADGMPLPSHPQEHGLRSARQRRRRHGQAGPLDTSRDRALSGSAHLQRGPACRFMPRPR